MIRRWWWLATIPLSALLWLAGGVAERLSLLCACAVAIAGVMFTRWRPVLTALTACLLLAACVSLAVHLVGDDFRYYYVWLYSAEALPWYLKLANLWGGDEGTLLFLATLMAFAATRLVHYRGWAGPGALALTAAFILGAIIWNPFVATPAEDLLRLQSQGMNAHLLRVWMAFHPPLIFIAYTYLLATTGAALEALATGKGDWPVIAHRYSRTGWLILSAGLAAGMWWAYEDYSFGQFWHWDPVQTSVFIVWALVTGHLHGLRIYRPAGFLARTLPGLALLAAVAVLVSMMVTRNEILASSHRYIGYTSFPLLLIMAMILALATVVAWIYSLKRQTKRRRQSEPVLMIRIAVLAFTVVAGIAAVQLANAYLSAYLELPRPASLKPFFETLARWTSPQELQELRQVFAQWDVDNFALNRWLAPLGLLIGLFGGHTFLRLRNKALGWLLTGAVAGIALITAFFLQPFDSLYTGTGMTSHRTVDIFFWLDAMLVAAIYLAVSALLWVLRMARRYRYRHRAVYGYFAPVGFIHLGVMVALLGALSASVLDSYAQRTLDYPDDFGKLQRFPDGYALRLAVDRDGYVPDGGRSSLSGGGFRAVGKVDLLLEHNGAPVETGSGHTVYRDDRPPVAGDRGPVRQMCEILDYRYARYAGGATHMLDPFIHRGFWRDVQVWLPAMDYAAVSGTDEEPGLKRQPSTLTVIIKTYPLISWLWLGLALTLLAAGVMTFFAWFGGRS